MPKVKTWGYYIRKKEPGSLRWTPCASKHGFPSRLAADLVAINAQWDLEQQDEREGRAVRYHRQLWYTEEQEGGE